MTDLATAKENLGGHSICLCKDGQCLFDDKRGIAPMMEFIARGYALAGYSVADRIVGKAAALLFVKCGIKAVFGKTLSVSARKTLEAHGIACEWETLTEVIIDRSGRNICPMEKTVQNCDDPERAYLLLREKLQAMRTGK